MKKFYRTKRLLLLPAETSFAKGIAEYYLRNREFLRAFEPQRDESFFTEETQRELLMQEDCHLYCIRTIFHLLQKNKLLLFY